MAFSRRLLGGTRRRQAGGQGSASVARPLLAFAGAGLVVVAILGFAATELLRRNARDEAIRNAQEVTRLAGNGIARPAFDRGLLRGDPAARRRLDRVVRGRILREPVVRVKVWSPDGRILYSDERRLEGRRLGLDEEERDAIRHRQVAAEVSDLDRPENRYEKRFGKLLEVYLPVRGPDGRQVLYEDYLRFSSISDSERRQLARLAPALVGALLLLWLLQLPLAWSLAKRLRQRRAERELLLQRALDSSQVERRRIARQLHDGVVQDLAGTSLSLAAAAERVDGAGDRETGDLVRGGAASVRRAMRELRALLVGIYPPSLRRSGLASAVGDLVAPLAERGVQVDVDVPEDLRLTAEAEETLYRCAQEGVRNAVKHADAHSVRVAVARADGRVTLTVSDDGRGFDPASGRNGDPGLGLRLLEDLAAESGGRVDVSSAPGEGTQLFVEVPAK
jgi:two-component system NarL family sensor kinase